MNMSALRASCEISERTLAVPVLDKNYALSASHGISIRPLAVPVLDESSALSASYGISVGPLVAPVLDENFFTQCLLRNSRKATCSACAQ
jgi:hypothetical protein